MHGKTSEAPDAIRVGRSSKGGADIGLALRVELPAAYPLQIPSV